MPNKVPENFTIADLKGRNFASVSEVAAILGADPPRRWRAPGLSSRTRHLAYGARSSATSDPGWPRMPQACPECPKLDEGQVP